MQKYFLFAVQIQCIMKNANSARASRFIRSSSLSVNRNNYRIGVGLKAGNGNMEIIVIKRKQRIFLTSMSEAALISTAWMNSGIGDRVMPQNNHRAFHIAIILTDQNVESVFTPRTQIITSASKFQLLYSDLTYRPQMWRDESHIVPACDD